MRIAPRDPNTHVAKVGIKNEVVRPDPALAHFQPLVTKVCYTFTNKFIIQERTGFSGGFKIPEEIRKSKEKHKSSKKEKKKEDEYDPNQ